MDLLTLLPTLLVAGVGAFGFIKLKIPAGALLGAMISTSLFCILTGKVSFPPAANPCVRIIAGALIGSRMKKSDVMQMKTIVLPAVLLVFGMLVLNISLGFGIHLLTGLDLSTAFLGSAPGGVQDMALIADDMGADAAQIAVLQVARVFMVIGIMPSLLRAFGKKYRLSHPAWETTLQKHPKQRIKEQSVISLKQICPQSEPNQQTKKISFIYKCRTLDISGRKVFIFVRTFILAFVGGFLVDLTGLPAGSMVGALVVTATASVFLKDSYIPKWIRKPTQVCAGMLIGSGIGLTELIRLREIMLPAVILVVVLLFANFAFGMIIHKATKLDLITCLFATSAGGAMDMALIADEFGADTPKIALLQLLRMICVVTLFPTIILFFTTIT